jgi:hypothetical protein
MFRNTLDLAHLQVATGAVDYNTAIKQAIKTIATEGTIVKYANSKSQLDVMVRRAVMSSISSLSNKMQSERAEQFNAPYADTSAHSGARPSHAVWQGRRFSYGDRSGKYPDFEPIKAQMEEPNCRHSWYPVMFDTDPIQYGGKELEKINDATVSYNGKQYTEFEAEQRLRSIETTIRKYKRQAGALEINGIDNSAELAKVKKWQREANSFTKETGIRRRPSNEQVYYGNAKGVIPKTVMPVKTIPVAEIPNIGTDITMTYKTVKDLPYAIKFNGIEKEYADNIKQEILKLNNEYPKAFIKEVKLMSSRKFGGVYRYGLDSKEIEVKAVLALNKSKHLSKDVFIGRHKKEIEYFKKKIEPNEYNTIYHEFAHSIDFGYALRYKEAPLNGLKTIKEYVKGGGSLYDVASEFNSYHKQILYGDKLSDKLWNSLRDDLKIDNIQLTNLVKEELGNYAIKDKAEFFAEGFANYKLTPVEKQSDFVKAFGKKFEELYKGGI